MGVAGREDKPVAGCDEGGAVEAHASDEVEFSGPGNAVQNPDGSGELATGGAALRPGPLPASSAAGSLRPCSSSNLFAEASPPFSAACKTVVPFLFVAWRSAPCSSKACMTASCPRRAASSNGVHWPRARASGAARLPRSSRARDSWPRWEASIRGVAPECEVVSKAEEKSRSNEATFAWPSWAAVCKAVAPPSAATTTEAEACSSRRVTAA
mmetsp:Transcript_36743/g.97942  ORF Transcript_36743/g.97942 Transcript_36743/m.97942 type:complete len:212 (+) Transcript_36743:314-949(+)